MVTDEGHVIDYLILELELYDFDRRLKGSHRCTLLVNLIVDEVLHRVELRYNAWNTCLDKDVSSDSKSGIFTQSDLLDFDILVVPVSIDLCLYLTPCILYRFVELG